MRSVVNAKEFALALGRVSSVLSKSAIPMLESVLVCFCGGKCILTATDMRIWAKTELPAYGDDFEFLLMKPAEMLKACRYYDGKLVMDLTIPNEDGYWRTNLAVSNGARTGSFEAESADDYPTFLTVEANSTFSVNAPKLLTRVQTVKYANEKAEGNELNSYNVRKCIQFSGNQIYALDGYRAAWDIDPTMEFPGKFMILTEHLEHLKLFKDEVTFQIGDRYVQVTDGITTLCLRQGEDVLFDLESALPKQYQEEFYVSPKEFLNALAYIKGFIPKKAFTFARICNGTLTLDNLPEKCSVILELSGSNTIPIGFDIRYMEDAMKQFKHESQVKVGIGGRSSPIVVEAEGRSNHALVLPGRLREYASAA